MMSDGEVVAEESTMDDSGVQFLSPSDELTEEPLETVDSPVQGELQDDGKIPAVEEAAESSSTADDEPLTKKVMNAVKSSALTAAKVTGDVIHKVGGVVHRNSSKESLDKGDDDNKEDAEGDDTDAAEDGDHSAEEKLSTTSKVLSAASAAGKSVVESARSAAKVTGEVMHKVTTSAETVLFPVPKTEEVKDGEENTTGAVNAPVEADAAPGENTAPGTEGEGGKNLWSSVKGISGAVGGFSSRAWASTTLAVTKTRRTGSSADAGPQPELDDGAEECSFEGGTAKNASPTKENVGTDGIDAAPTTGNDDNAQRGDGVADAQRGRADSISNKLLSSVRRMSHTASEAASAALKAAEPVTEKMSHGAVAAWTSTKEKVRAAAAPKNAPAEEEAETSSVVCETSGSVVGSVTDENGETVDSAEIVAQTSMESFDTAAAALLVEGETSSAYPEAADIVTDEAVVVAVEDRTAAVDKAVDEVANADSCAAETAADGSEECAYDGAEVTADDGADETADDGADETADDGAEVTADDGDEVAADDGADETADDGDEVAADDCAEEEGGVDDEAKAQPTGGKKKKRRGKGKN